MTSEEKVVTGQGTFKTEWTYNSAGLLSTQAYPNGTNREVDAQVHTEYLMTGAVNKVYTIPENPYVYSTTYDAAGRVDLRTLGSAPNR